MTRFSKLSLAALGGVTVLMLAVPAEAATGHSKFYASIDDLRRYCERLDEPLWKKKRNYGCGQFICADGVCQVRKSSPPKKTYPQHSLRPGDGGKSDNGGVRGGGSNGGSNSSSASGPN